MLRWCRSKILAWWWARKAGKHLEQIREIERYITSMGYGTFPESSKNSFGADLLLYRKSYGNVLLQMHPWVLEREPAGLYMRVTVYINGLPTVVEEKTLAWPEIYHRNIDAAMLATIHKVNRTLILMNMPPIGTVN